MNVFSYRLRPTSPWATAPQADSLFGALCWELVRRQGEPDLLRMLDRFRKGDPPFVISNAFPGDLLPRPLVLGHDELPLHPYVTRAEFTAIREGNAGFEPSEHGDLFEVSRTLHKDYETEDITWSKNGPGYFTLYGRVVPEWVAPLQKLLQSLGAYGFGKRRGLGRGQFEVEGKPEPCPWLEPMPFESGFVTLSDFVPQENDPARGRWGVRVKYPKLSAGHTKPHALKGRLLQLEAGSCFQCPGRPRRWYGGLVGGGQGAVQYGFALAIGIKWPFDHI
jgi:CRISPR-associated protein Csm4